MVLQAHSRHRVCSDANNNDRTEVEDISRVHNFYSTICVGGMSE